MLSKLLLDATRVFERTLATRQMAEMVAAFLQGKPTHISLGCEQGIEGWDDLVIQCNDGSFRHHQLKRQLTDFDERPSQRTFKRNAPKTLQDLKPLDESMKDLADHFKDLQSGMLSPERLFVLELPKDVGIHDEIGISDLQSLCHQCTNPTTTAGVQRSVQNL